MSIATKSIPGNADVSIYEYATSYRISVSSEHQKRNNLQPTPVRKLYKKEEVKTKEITGEWTEIISPKTKLLDLRLHEIWRYRDLLLLAVTFLARNEVLSFVLDQVAPVSWQQLLHGIATAVSLPQ